MRKLYLIAVAVFGTMFLFSCEKEAKDRAENVEITIYPEIGYSGNVLSDIWSDALVISDTDDNEKRLLDNITERFDYQDYERGYQYVYKAKKVWMHNPPQDVSYIKYIFLELLSKKRDITENSEKDIQLYVLPQKVEYRPWISKEAHIDGGMPHYEALHVKDMTTGYWLALRDIDGFEFEKGYEYMINVKEVTHANPYSLQYKLVNVVSKEESKKKWPGVVYDYEF